jgi:hypothetical protein
LGVYMTTPAPVGVIRLSIDGEWDIENLRELSESLAESYGLFYPLVAHDEEVRNRLQDLLRKQFWSGDFESRHFGRFLYRAIPQEESLKLKRFSYASAGVMEIGGVLVALLFLARIARAWIKTGEEFLTFWEKVDKFFEKRRALRRPRREIALDETMAASSDEARKLVFEVGDKLGFDALSCDKLIEIVGNPISALKYLVVAGQEGRKLAELEKAGLLQLPTPTSEAVVIQTTSSKTTSRRRVTKDEVRKGLRGKKKDE